MVTLVSRTSSSVTLSWTTPTHPNGLVTSYTVTLVPSATVGLPVATGNTTTTSLEVRIPEMVLLTIVSDLPAATTYSATLHATNTRGTTRGIPVDIATAESGTQHTHNT